jgi:hypothetical protein
VVCIRANPTPMAFFHNVYFQLEIIWRLVSLLFKPIGNYFKYFGDILQIISTVPGFFRLEKNIKDYVCIEMSIRDVLALTVANKKKILH